MIDRAEAREILLDLLEEEALLVGGILALHKVDDHVVWELMQGLDGIRRKSLARLDDVAGDEAAEQEAAPRTSHPAVEEFLARIQRDRRRCASRSG